jgi:hypothetical protein
MPAIRCPSCDTGLKVSADLAGKSIRCPKCAKAIRVPEGDPDDEADDTTARKPASAKKANAAVVPKARRASPPARGRQTAIEDDDDNERDDDDDERDDDRPRRRGKSNNTLYLWLGLGAAAFVLIAAGLTVGLLLWSKRDKGSTASSSSVDTTGFTISIKNDGDLEVGKSFTKSKSKKTLTKTKFLDAKGVVVRETTEEELEEEQYTETILERDDKGPKKFKRTYSKAFLTKGGVRKDYSYQGRTVVFQLSPGLLLFEVQAEGHPPLTLEEQKRLGTQENRRANGKKPFDMHDLLPDKSVNVGDEWNIDPKKTGFMPEDQGSSTVGEARSTGKLVKTYEKDGRQFGTMEFSLTIRGTVNSDGGSPTEIAFSVTLDTPIDKSCANGTMTASVTSKYKLPSLDGNTVTADTDLQATLKEQVEEK